MPSTLTICRHLVEVALWWDNALLGESAAKGQRVLISMNAQACWEMPAGLTSTKIQVGMPTSLETCHGMSNSNRFEVSASWIGAVYCRFVGRLRSRPLPTRRRARGRQLTSRHQSRFDQAPMIKVTRS